MRRILALTFILCGAMSGQAADISVTATYLARIATPPGAVLDVLYVGRSAADSQPEVLAMVRLLDVGNPPYVVTLTAPRTVGPTAIQVRLRREDARAFFDGVGRGQETATEVIMRPATLRAAPLTGTRWRLMVLGGTVIGSLDGEREIPWLEFLPDGRIAGTGGCNRLGAGYAVAPDGVISFTQGLSTMMACDEAVMQRERTLFDVLARSTGYALRDDVLSLKAGDDVLAVWVADPV
jgi:putative lipoprotein